MSDGFRKDWLTRNSEPNGKTQWDDTGPDLYPSYICFLCFICWSRFIRWLTDQITCRILKGLVFFLTACQMVAATVMLALPFNTLLMGLVFYLVGKWPGKWLLDQAVFLKSCKVCVCVCVFHAEVSSVGFLVCDELIMLVERTQPPWSAARYIRVWLGCPGNEVTLWIVRLVICPF